MKKLIKVYFCGKDWNKSDITNFPYREELTKFADIVIDSNADLLFAKESPSSMAEFYKLKKSDQIKIFSATEAVSPNFNEFDFAMGFDPLIYGERYIRRNTLHRFKNFFNYDPIFEPTLEKREFQFRKPASFIYSNSNAHKNRDDFYRKLQKKLPVDSFGKHLQTIKVSSESSNWRESKIEIEKMYKFSIAIENAYHLGYTSEKIITSFLAGAIPLYWGNPEIEKDFNPERFINLHNFRTLELSVDFIVDLEKNTDQIMSILEKPVLTSTQLKEYSNFEIEFQNFFENIIENSTKNKYLAPLGTFQNSISETRKYVQGFERILLFFIKSKNWARKKLNHQKLPKR